MKNSQTWICFCGHEISTRKAMTDHLRSHGIDISMLYEDEKTDKPFLMYVYHIMVEQGMSFERALLHMRESKIY